MMEVTIYDMISNPVLVGVVIMLFLCVMRFNIFLSILTAGMLSGMLSIATKTGFDGVGGFFDSLTGVMRTFIKGMSGNLETSLSYILVGALASAVAKTNLTAYLVRLVSKYLSNNYFLLLLAIAFISCFSQNLVPIHVAFIPILIPPLIPLFNKLKIDRRAVAAAVTFGITTPYMTLPLGFGLIFQQLIADALNTSGVKVSQSDVASVVWLMGGIMIFGLLASIIYFKKPRQYQEIKLSFDNIDDIKFGKKELLVGIGLLITLISQLLFHSLPLSALLGFVFISFSGGIEYSKINEVFTDGFELMGFVAFIMLVAAGFGGVLQSSDSIKTIVDFTLSLTNSKTIIAFCLLSIGLLVTLGIGSSFGTISVITPIFAPICLAMGFSTEAIIFIIACAGAVGDTGSPASEATLSVDIGLNADGQNSHIKDVCIPTFVFYNIPLVVFGTIIAVYLG